MNTNIPGEGELLIEKKTGRRLLVTCIDYADEGCIEVVDIDAKTHDPDDLVLDDLEDFINQGPIGKLVLLPPNIDRIKESKEAATISNLFTDAINSGCVEKIEEAIERLDQSIALEKRRIEDYSYIERLLKHSRGKIDTCEMLKVKCEGAKEKARTIAKAEMPEVDPIIDPSSLAGTWPGEDDDGFEESIDKLRHPER